MESNSGWWAAPVRAPGSAAEVALDPAPAQVTLRPAAPRRPGGKDAWPPLAPDQDESRTQKSWLRRKLSALVAAVVAVLAKLKAILLLLPKLKLLTTVGTMLVSVAAYSFVFGWAFAVGFVILLLVHEMGHVIELRRQGIRASAPMFIPFLGAVISARSLGKNALAEAKVGLAGPILGTIGSAVCILIWHATGSNIWRALAFTGLFLNLFNLLPVVPLDGGRAMAAMAPWMWFVGFAAMIPLVFIFPNPVILLILVVAGYETYRRWTARKTGGIEQRSYYSVRPRDRALVAAVYLGLIALLVVGMHGTALTSTFS